jgi:HTH-like domain
MGGSCAWTSDAWRYLRRSRQAWTGGYLRARCLSTQTSRASATTSHLRRCVAFSRLSYGALDAVPICLRRHRLRSRTGGSHRRRPPGPDHPVEEAGPGWLALPLRGGRQPEAPSRRGVAGAALSRDWPTQSLARLAAKKRATPLRAARTLIDPTYAPISVARQCALLEVPRSTWYYHSRGESAENLALMRLLDEQYTRTPFYGIRRMTAWLCQQGYPVNPKRVSRLLRLRGIEAIYPKPRLSRPGTTPQRYPYLLRDLPIQQANQVWSTDITFVRMRRGFLYLVAILRLVQSVRALLGAVQHTGRGILPRRSARGLDSGPAGDLQHRSGGTVHQPSLYRSAGGCRHSHQSGWAGSRSGQCLCGTALALGQVGRNLLTRLGNGSGSVGWLGAVFGASTTTSGCIRPWGIGPQPRSTGWRRHTELSCFP